MRQDGAAAAGATGFPPILLGRGAIENISAGTAGVLLGTRRDGAIAIEEARALPAGQRPAARRSILELMGRQQGPEVVGFYRCQRAGEPCAATDDDESLCARFFPDSEAVFLLVRPGSAGVALFAWRNGRLRPVAEPAPARAPAQEEERGAGRSRWIGVATAAGMIALGAAALLLWPLALEERTPAPPTPPAVGAPAPAPQPPLAALASDVSGVLERWAAAEQSGRIEAVLPFYAPVLESYFDEPRATHASIRDRAERLLGRYGKPETIRLLDVRVEPAGRNRATATFRVRWRRMAGGRTRSGEDRERMQLVRTGDGWRIVSED
jgi:ketosteroid isomerase-like protein